MNERQHRIDRNSECHSRTTAELHRNALDRLDLFISISLSSIAIEIDGAKEEKQQLVR